MDRYLRNPNHKLFENLEELYIYICGLKNENDKDKIENRINLVIVPKVLRKDYILYHLKQDYEGPWVDCSTFRSIDFDAIKRENDELYHKWGSDCFLVFKCVCESRDDKVDVVSTRPKPVAVKWIHWSKVKEYYYLQPSGGIVKRLGAKLKRKSRKMINPDYLFYPADPFKRAPSQ